MKKKIVFVFHNGLEGEIITYDCSLRLKAASILASKDSGVELGFVGGGGLKPEAGTVSMQKFWQKTYPNLANQLLLLEKSNNTADSVCEIAEYISSHKEEKEVVLVSSAYHIARIKFFAKCYGLSATFIAAEDVLALMEEFDSEIKKYRNSVGYAWKIMKEKIAMFYIVADCDQKMVRLWRKYVRNLKK